jgi:hypothetical protein
MQMMQLPSFIVACRTASALFVARSSSLGGGGSSSSSSSISSSISSSYTAAGRNTTLTLLRSPVHDFEVRSLVS